MHTMPHIMSTALPNEQSRGNDPSIRSRSDSATILYQKNFFLKRSLSRPLFRTLRRVIGSDSDIPSDCFLFCLIMLAFSLYKTMAVNYFNRFPSTVIGLVDSILVPPSARQ